MTATKYSPDLAKRFYEACCQGKSIKTIAKEFMVRRDIFADWAKDENKPEFKEAYELGKEAAEAYYEELGRTNLENPKFKESLYKFITGVQFGWSEKMEQTVKSHDKSTSDAELDQQIKDKLKALGISASDVEQQS